MKKSSEFIIKLLVIIISCLIIVILIVKRFIYFVTSNNYEDTDCLYRVIKYRNLYGRYLEGQNNKVVLLCNGNRGNLSKRMNKAMTLKNMGYSVLLFDYSGFGKSKGVPSEEQMKVDATCMLSILLQTFNKENIIIYGESTGASVAAFISKRYSIPKLILESTIINMAEYIKIKYRFLSFLSVFFVNDFNIYNDIKDYTGKILSLHCRTDEVSPYILTGNLQRNSDMHICMDGSHYNPEIPWSNIKSFIEN